MSRLCERFAAALIIACFAGKNASAQKRASAQVDIFSGRPNPHWELSPAETQNVVSKLRKLPSALPLLPPQLGYRGVLIQFNNKVTWQIFQGRAHLIGTNAWVSDHGRQLEKFVLATGAPHLDGELFKTLLQETGIEQISSEVKYGR